MKTKLILWLVATMLRWTLPTPQHEAAAARYEEIAKDAVEVAFDPAEKPLFGNSIGRTQSVIVMLAIASYESGFRKDVEEGRARGDHGRSWCLMQINLGTSRVRLDGDGWAWAKEGEPGAWSGEDLAADRQKCFRMALHFARVSYRACGDLSLYTSGACSSTEKSAQFRALRAKDALRRNPIDWLDVDVLSVRSLASSL